MVPLETDKRQSFMNSLAQRMKNMAHIPLAALRDKMKVHEEESVPDRFSIGAELKLKSRKRLQRLESTKQRSSELVHDVLEVIREQEEEKRQLDEEKRLQELNRLEQLKKGEEDARRKRDGFIMEETHFEKKSGSLHTWQVCEHAAL